MLNLIHVLDAVAGNANVTAAATEAAEQTNKTPMVSPRVFTSLLPDTKFLFSRSPLRSVSFKKESSWIISFATDVPTLFL